MSRNNPRNEEGIIQSEGQRRLNLLETRYELYQRQAVQLLQISLASFGVVATFWNFGVLTETLEILIKNIQPGTSVQNLSSIDVVGGDVGATVLVMGISAMGLLGAIGFIFFLLMTVVAAGLVVYPNDDELRFGSNDLGGFYTRESTDTVSEPRFQYEQLFHLKKETVKKTRKNLQRGYQSAGLAISGAVTLSISILVLAFAGPELTQIVGLYSVGLLVIAIFYLFIQVRTHPEFYIFATSDAEIVGGLIFATTIAIYTHIFPEYAGPVYDGLPLILLLPMGLPLLAIQREQQERFQLGIKSIMIFPIIFGLLGAFITTYPGDASRVIPNWLFLYLIYISLLAVVLSFEVLVISAAAFAVNWVRQFSLTE